MNLKSLVLGVLAACSVSAVAQVTNGSFETGNFSGWTIDPEPINWPMVMFSPFDGMVGTDGDRMAAFGGTGSTYYYMSQSIPTTAGTTYLIRFDAATINQVGNSMRVEWNGGVLSEGLAPFRHPNGGLVAQAYTVTATGSSSVLKIGAYNTTDYTCFDNVRVTALPPLTTLTANPNPVLSGSTTTGTVTLGSAAPVDMLVNLSDNTTVISTPATVLVPAGQTTADFLITTFETNTTVVRQVSASLNGVTRTVNLTLTANIKAKTFTMSPTTIQSGNSTTGTITLNGPALPGGANVAISSGSTVIQVPSSKLIGAGQTSGTFTIASLVVSATVARPVTVSYGGVSITKYLTLTPSFNIVSLIVSPSTVQGGQTTTGRVTLGGAAPAGGVTVSLESLSSAILVPSTVTVPQGATFVNFNVTTFAVGSTFTRYIKATRAGVSKTAAITLTP